jgi:hypothetical protein
MLKKLLALTCILGSLNSLLASNSYERVSVVRIAQQQENYQSMLDARHKKRIIAVSGLSLVGASGLAWLVYSWLKEDEPAAPNTEPSAPANPQQNPIFNLQAEAVKDFIDQQREMRTATGMFRSKFTEGVAFGLAAALVSFILNRSKNALSNGQSIVERIIPLSDTPILINALYQLTVTTKHYAKMITLLTAQEVTPGSFAATIFEKNRQLAHNQLVDGVEQFTAVCQCFENTLGKGLSQQLDLLFGQLAQLTNQLADEYELAKPDVSSITQLSQAIPLQAEHLNTLLLPFFEDLGYAV